MKPAKPANDNARATLLQRSGMAPDSAMFALAAAAVSLLAILAGLSVISPPWVERLQRFDQARISSLESIFESVRAFARDKGRLPQSLDELQLSPGTQPYRATNDPTTGAAFEYLPGTADNFQLCATFDLGNKDNAPARNPRWPHDPGRQCFALTAPPK